MAGSVNYAQWRGPGRDPGLAEVASLRLELHRAKAEVRSCAVDDGRVEVGLGEVTVRLDGVADPVELPAGPMWLCDADSDGEWVQLVLECGDGAWRLVRGRHITVDR